VNAVLCLVGAYVSSSLSALHFQCRIATNDCYYLDPIHAMDITFAFFVYKMLISNRKFDLYARLVGERCFRTISNANLHFYELKYIDSGI
jgi:hypothetical protein